MSWGLFEKVLDDDDDDDEMLGYVTFVAVQ